MVAALRAAGAEVRVHDEHFAPNTPDTTWLAEAGGRGWAVLSKDRRIRTRGSELAQLLTGRIAAFVLTSAEMTGDEMATAFVAALPAMTRLLDRQSRPFIARIGRSGQVELLALPSDSSQAR